MSEFEPGDTVELVATDSQQTKLKPGARGKVTKFDSEAYVLHVSWQGGSKLVMLLSDGDVVKKIAPATEAKQ